MVAGARGGGSRLSAGGIGADHRGIGNHGPARSRTSPVMVPRSLCAKRAVPTILIPDGLRFRQRNWTDNITAGPVCPPAISSVAMNQTLIVQHVIILPPDTTTFAHRRSVRAEEDSIPPSRAPHHSARCGKRRRCGSWSRLPRHQRAAALDRRDLLAQQFGFHAQTGNYRFQAALFLVFDVDFANLDASLAGSRKPCLAAVKGLSTLAIQELFTWARH